MKSVLVCQDFWSVTSGGSVKPEPSDANHGAVASWIRKDEQTKATITLCVNPSQILHIKNTTSAKAAWDALWEIHKPKGPARKVTLYKALMSMRMLDNENAREYACKFCRAADKLAEAGIEVQKEMLVVMLLGIWPKSYENFVVALESRDELPSLDIVKVKLMEESARRKENSDTTSAERGSFLAKDNSQKHNYEGRNKRVSNFQHIKCFQCERKGHFASHCRNRVSGKNFNKDDHHDKNAALALVGNNFFCNIGKILNENTWCVDSGATSHLRCRREMFVQFK